MANVNLNVNMNGEEYIRYKEQQRIPISDKTKKFFLAALPYWLSAFVIGIGGIILVDLIPKEIKLYAAPEFMEFYGIPFLKIVPSAFLILIGFAWLIHGVGFSIINT